jgi:hypothetical protein
MVSAIVVILADKGKLSLVGIATIPIMLFLHLDAYYLSLEREFRTVYNDFVRKLHYGNATVDDVYYVVPHTGVAASSMLILKASLSISVWPFYLLLAVMTLLTRFWVL